MESMGMMAERRENGRQTEGLNHHIFLEEEKKIFFLFKNIGFLLTSSFHFLCLYLD